MAWLLVALAGLLEVAWSVGLKQSAGFSRLGPSLWTLAAMGLSFWLLSLSLRTLPLGTAYPIWVGIGAVGTVLVGAWRFDEPLSTARGLCVLLIVAGVIGLKLATPPSSAQRRATEGPNITTLAADSRS